jgi:hypothetical protein
MMASTPLASPPSLSADLLRPPFANQSPLNRSGWHNRIPLLRIRDNIERTRAHSTIEDIPDSRSGNRPITNERPD